ncbi:MAG: folylpolyglutamate synthase/dihydrofolate synthase family protein [Candidatus Caldatribacteriota bacterium]|nr:folylpolyglutamate synthase/dihydrofolate synthase family protein [Candidatus Caldatribacteriota bacterium]
MITYNKALDYIYNLSKYGIKLGLNNIRELLFLLGNPHEKLKIIHVGGTNGKGSTASIINRILNSEGYKVGLYTSPHLIDFTERMKINNRKISRVKVCKLLERIKPYITEVAHKTGCDHPTFFEVITAMAFLYFYEEKVDFLVLEVGLGGRLDATNICNPLVSVITHIDYDHMDKLGNSLQEIAREKAGIIKQGGLVINSKQYKEVTGVIKKIAQEKKSRIFNIGTEVNYEIISSGLNGLIFNLKGINNNYSGLNIPLLGNHQAENASVAITAIEALNLKGINISKKAIIEGLKRVKWEGRLEIIQRKPTLILDGAHNPNGIEIVSKVLKEIFSYKKLILVLAIFSDKDYKKMIQKIAPMGDLIIVTMAKSKRAASSKVMAVEISKYKNHDKIVIKKDVPQAIYFALLKAQKDDLICVTGSLHTIGEAKEYFKIKSKNKHA